MNRRFMNVYFLVFNESHAHKVLDRDTVTVCVVNCWFCMLAEVAVTSLDQVGGASLPTFTMDE